MPAKKYKTPSVPKQQSVNPDLKSTKTEDYFAAIEIEMVTLESTHETGAFTLIVVYGNHLIGKISNVVVTPENSEVDLNENFMLKIKALDNYVMDALLSTPLFFSMFEGEDRVDLKTFAEHGLAAAVQTGVVGQGNLGILPLLTGQEETESYVVLEPPGYQDTMFFRRTYREHPRLLIRLNDVKKNLSSIKLHNIMWLSVESIYNVDDTHFLESADHTFVFPMPSMPLEEEEKRLENFILLTEEPKEIKREDRRTLFSKKGKTPPKKAGKRERKESKPAIKHEMNKKQDIPIYKPPVDITKPPDFDLIQFDNGAYTELPTYDIRKKWASLSSINGAPTMTKDRVKTDASDLISPIQIDITKKFRNDTEPRIEWNMVRPIWLHEELERNIKNRIAQYGVWPFELLVLGKIYKEPEEIHDNDSETMLQEKRKLDAMKNKIDSIFMNFMDIIDELSDESDESSFEDTKESREKFNNLITEIKRILWEYENKPKHELKKSSIDEFSQENISSTVTSEAEETQKQKSGGDSNNEQDAVVVIERRAYIAWIDLSPLLEPGSTHLRTVGLLQFFDKEEAASRWGLHTTFSGQPDEMGRKEKDLSALWKKDPNELVNICKRICRSKLIINPINIFLLLGRLMDLRYNEGKILKNDYETDSWDKEDFNFETEEEEEEETSRRMMKRNRNFNANSGAWSTIDAELNVNKKSLLQKNPEHLFKKKISKPTGEKLDGSLKSDYIGTEHMEDTDDDENIFITQPKMKSQYTFSNATPKQRKKSGKLQSDSSKRSKEKSEIMIECKSIVGGSPESIFEGSSESKETQFRNKYKSKGINRLDSKNEQILPQNITNRNLKNTTQTEITSMQHKRSSNILDDNMDTDFDKIEPLSEDCESNVDLLKKNMLEMVKKYNSLKKKYESLKTAKGGDSEEKDQTGCPLAGDETLKKKINVESKHGEKTQEYDELDETRFPLLYQHRLAQMNRIWKERARSFIPEYFVNKKGEHIFVIIDIKLLHPLVPKPTIYRLSFNIKELVSEEKSKENTDTFYTRDMDGDFEKTITSLTKIITNEYQDYKTAYRIVGNTDDIDDSFYSYLEKSSAHKVIAESLNHELMEYLADSLRDSFPKEGNPFQKKLRYHVGWLYTRLVERMQTIVNQIIIEGDNSMPESDNGYLANISSEDWFLFAVEAIEEMDYNRAKYYLSKRLEGENITDPLKWIDYAVIALRIGDHPKALECIKEALALDSRSKEGLVLYAVMLMTEGKFEAALVFFEALISFYPMFVEGWMAFHMFYLIVENKCGADITLVAGTKISRDHKIQPPYKPPQLSWDNEASLKDIPGNYMRSAVYFLSFNLYEFAEVCLAQELERIEKKSAEWVYYLSVCHHIQGRYEDSAKHLTKLIGADKIVEEPQIWMLLGNNFWQMGMKKCAVQMYLLGFIKDVDCFKFSHMTFIRCGFFLLDNEQAEFGKQMFLRAVKGRGTPMGWLGLGICLFMEGNIEDAELAFEEANMLDTTLATAWGYLALISLYRFKQDQFLHCFREARRYGLKDKKLAAQLQLACQEIMENSKKTPSDNPSKQKSF